MAYATTIYPARAALDTLLRAYTWTGDTPTVAWGPPSEEEDQAFDLVYQGTPVIEEVAFPGLSLRSDEEYTLPIVADVREYGDDEKATEQHAWSHVNNRFTGIDIEMGNVPQPSQWRTQIVVRVSVVGIVPA
jgi:hypothetical protein